MQVARHIQFGGNPGELTIKIFYSYPLELIDLIEDPESRVVVKTYRQTDFQYDIDQFQEVLQNGGNFEDIGFDLVDVTDISQNELAFEQTFPFVREDIADYQINVQPQIHPQPQIQQAQIQVQQPVIPVNPPVGPLEGFSLRLAFGSLIVFGFVRKLLFR